MTLPHPPPPPPSPPRAGPGSLDGYDTFTGCGLGDGAVTVTAGSADEELDGETDTVGAGAVVATSVEGARVTLSRCGVRCATARVERADGATRILPCGDNSSADTTVCTPDRGARASASFDLAEAMSLARSGVMPASFPLHAASAMSTTPETHNER